MPINYPVNITFKKIALTSKITVSDSTGVIIGYAHQKMLKLKEQILLFTDTSKTQPMGQIRADRVIDFSPLLTYYDSTEQKVFAVKRHGKKSIWKADYDILASNDVPVYKVREDNAWIKVMNSLFSSIPLLGILAGYVFNPTYNVTNMQGVQVAQIVKQPAFLESSYVLNLLVATDPYVSFLPLACTAVLTRERLRG